jgi:hypothetical protein
VLRPPGARSTRVPRLRSTEAFAPEQGHSFPIGFGNLNHHQHRGEARIGKQARSSLLPHAHYRSAQREPPALRLATIDLGVAVRALINPRLSDVSAERYELHTQIASRRTCEAMRIRQVPSDFPSYSGRECTDLSPLVWPHRLPPRHDGLAPPLLELAI